MNKWAYIENIATLAIMGGMVTGMLAYGAGGFSLFAFLLLFNLNSTKAD